MEQTDTNSLADELEQAFPAGYRIGVRLSDDMFRRILSALRQHSAGDAGAVEALKRIADYPVAGMPVGSIIKIVDELQVIARVALASRPTEAPEANRLARLEAENARLRKEMERRDKNENLNCLNWGPCSRHDGPMGDEPEEK